LSRWDGLVRFLDDGRIEMDTNSVERAMRPIALNRKNGLFAGHDAGAANWACLASLIETAKIHGVDPQGYLDDRFHESCHKRGIHLGFRIPIYVACAQD
jgi:hypothetical protein